MAIKSNIGLIKENGGGALVRRDQALIREALSTTEFVFDGFIWVTKDENFDISYWLTYEVDTVLSAHVLSAFVEQLLELRADSKNDQRIRNLSNEELTDVAFDLRYAKGTGDVSMYHRMLVKNGFIVFDASVQIERICHTIRTEMEYRME